MQCTYWENPNVGPFHSYTSVVKGNSALPVEDRLMKFLVDNSTDAEEVVQCANCDQESNKKVNFSFKKKLNTYNGTQKMHELQQQSVSPPTFTSLLPWNTILFSWFLKLFCVLCRILDWCTTATLAANHCAAPAGSWLTRPECFPTTRSCPWPNVPKPNTGSAVRKKET